MNTTTEFTNPPFGLRTKFAIQIVVQFAVNVFERFTGHVCIFTCLAA